MPFAPCARLAAWLAAASLLTGTAACARGGGRTELRAGSDSLYIGVAASRAATNAAYFNGVQLAIARLNAERRRGTPPFALRLPPAEQPTQVVVAAAFRDDASVIGVVGHTGSAQTMDAAPIYADVENGGRRALVAVSPTATNPSVTRASDWVFRVCPTDVDAAQALARFAADSMRARRVAVIYRNDLFGRGFTRAFGPRLEERGSTLVERDPYLSGITEFDAYAARIARRRADVVVVAGGGTDAPAIIRAMRAAGASPAVLGTDDLSALANEPAMAREFRGTRYVAFFVADRATTPEGRAFAAAYQAKFGTPADHRAALSYDAAMLIGLAAAEVGPDRSRIRDWIARRGRGAPAFAGATGSIAFDEWRDPVGKQVVMGEVLP